MSFHAPLSLLPPALFRLSLPLQGITVPGVPAPVLPELPVPLLLGAGHAAPRVALRHAPLAARAPPRLPLQARAPTLPLAPAAQRLRSCALFQHCRAVGAQLARAQNVLHFIPEKDKVKKGQNYKTKNLLEDLFEVLIGCLYEDPILLRLAGGLPGGGAR